MKTEADITRMVFSREGVGLTATILMRNDLFFGKFVTDHPTLILVRRGKKTLKTGFPAMPLLSQQALPATLQMKPTKGNTKLAGLSARR